MAGRQHLTVAIKVEEDSGIDFICQAEQASGAKSANPMIPAHFGVGVRATNTVTGRVKLNCADATNKLLSRSPVLRDEIINSGTSDLPLMSVSGFAVRQTR